MMRNWLGERRFQAKVAVIEDLRGNGPSYVLDMMRRTGFRSGRMYSTLDALVDIGIVTATWHADSNGRARRVYRLVAS